MKTLKSTLVALLIIVIGAAQANAQKANSDVTITKVVEVSADKVWAKLRQMDDIDKYSSAIAKVQWTGNHGVGGQRLCTAPEGNGYFKESIVSFDDSQRSYSYALLEGVPTKGMVNNFKVVDLGYNKSMVIWTSSYEQFLENPNMTEQQFLGFINQSVSEMITNITSAAAKS